MCLTLTNEMLSPMHVSLVARELCERTSMWREDLLKITLRAKIWGSREYTTVFTPLRSEVEC